MSETSSNSVNGMVGSYARLSNYNGADKSIPVPGGTVVGQQVIPQWGSVGYNTLMHNSGTPSYSGYPNIQTAYAGDGTSCGTKYVNRMCK